MGSSRRGGRPIPPAIRRRPRHIWTCSALFTLRDAGISPSSLLEGHVDAVQIVFRYGTSSQVAALRARIAAGATLGIWNAGLPGEPLVLTGGRLTGGKGYASGRDTGLTRW